MPIFSHLFAAELSVERGGHRSTPFAAASTNPSASLGYWCHFFGRDTKATSVFSGSEPRDPLEYFSERRGVAIANMPGNLVDRLARQLECFTRFRDTNLLGVLGRPKARRLFEPSPESALFQSCAC